MQRRDRLVDVAKDAPQEPEQPGSDDLGGLARAIAGAPPGSATEQEARLYRLLAPRVRLYGRKHLRGEAEAEDLMQRVLWTTLARLRSGEIRDPEAIASFALGTSRIMASDLRRGERRHREIFDRYAPTFSTSSAPAEPPDTARLGGCLEQLAERERTVVVMTFYDERSAGEIAQELTLTAANVRVVRHRALARLRRCMENHGTGGASG
jgi:RNA polymerase sigma-70 factor (ECF subfamily)